MNDSENLREQMWDLVYGLLTPAESQPLIARIKSDPQAARLYAEVRLQADLVAHAARVEDPDLVFQVEPAAGAAEQPTPARRAAEPAAARRAAARRSWLAGIAATALAALLAVGFFWPQPNRQTIAAKFPVVDVSGLEKLPAGVSTKIALSRSSPVSIDGAVAATEFAGQAANVEVELVDSENQVRFRHELLMRDKERAEVELPGEAIRQGVRLIVTATNSE